MIDCQCIRAAGLPILLSTLLFACHLSSGEPGAQSPGTDIAGTADSDAAFAVDSAQGQRFPLPPIFGEPDAGATS